jgi:hypothetical protein
MAGRLLNQYIFAGLARPNGSERMPVITCGHRQNVNILGLKQSIDSNVALGTIALRFLHNLRRLIRASLVNIADGSDSGFGHAYEALYVLETPATDTNDSNLHGVVRGNRLSGRGRAGCRSRGSRKYKMSTIHEGHLSVWNSVVMHPLMQLFTCAGKESPHAI